VKAKALIVRLTNFSHTEKEMMGELAMKLI